MRLARPELGDIARRYGPVLAAQQRLSGDQHRALRDLAACRTAALGGHRSECQRCGHVDVSYNSCRNRHCPRCQRSAQAEWFADRERELLPVPYFHVVFTLPEELAPVALANPRHVYGLLFHAAADTLGTIARDPKRLGAEVGFLAVLHTWGQTLRHHPHVHCVVPGGGLAPDHTRWIASRKRFFLPVRVLSRAFRHRFLQGLESLRDRAALRFVGSIASLAADDAWRRLLAEVRAKEWVVYAKPPFGGPQQVLRYLARYTHRVAIGNDRILALADDHVVFRYKDSAHGRRPRTMRLGAVTFLRRFLLHVLPSGFVRIRHYGFLANRARKQLLPLAQRLAARDAAPVREHASARPVEPVQRPDPRRCPACGELTCRITVLEREPVEPAPPALPGFDTS